MNEQIMFKDLTDKQIDDFSDLQIYNIMFGPVVEARDAFLEYDEDKQKKSCVAVYGATSPRVKCRFEAMREYLEKHNSGMIIFSGGKSWDGIGLNPSMEQRKKMWGIPGKLNSIISRADEFIEDFEPVKDAVIDRMVEEYTEDVIYQMLMDSKLNDELTGEYNMRSEDKKDENFAEWFFEKTRSDWVESGKIGEYEVNQYVVNKLSEADIMEMYWNGSVSDEIKDKVVVEYDKESNNTGENAKNSVAIMMKHMDIDTIAVVSEWPYLLRAMLTTEKQASKINAKVAAIPAEKFYLTEIRLMELLRAEAKKIIAYNDVGNADISKYIEMKEPVKGGPDFGFNPSPNPKREEKNDVGEI